MPDTTTPPILATSNVAQAAPEMVRLLPGIRALYDECQCTGFALTCRCGPGDNLGLHRALQRASPGSVLVCDASGRTDVGHFGELMARDAQRRGVVGLIISGSVRDAADLHSLGFPVFCMGTMPFQGRKSDPGSVEDPISLNGAEVRTGDVIVADRDAALVVPRSDWETIFEKAQEIAAHEEYIREHMRLGRTLSDILSIPIT